MTTLESVLPAPRASFVSRNGIGMLALIDAQRRRPTCDDREHPGDETMTRDALICAAHF